jgi:hypothetical protein
MRTLAERGVSEQESPVVNQKNKNRWRVKGFTPRRSQETHAAGRTYAGTITPSAEAELEQNNEPVFRTSCVKQHHYIDPTTAIFAPCTDSCGLMILFGMYYCYLGIVCRRCKCLVPLQILEHHLRIHHARTGGTFWKTDYTFVASHIVKTHDLRVTDADPVLNAPPLSGAVSGLDAPWMAYKCPYCPNKWIAAGSGDTHNAQTSKTHQHVHRDHDKEKIPSEFLSRYIVRPYRRSEMLDRVLVFIDGWVPGPGPGSDLALPGNSNSSNRVYRRGPIAADGAKFLQDLSWPEYISNLKASNTQLRQLVRHPNLKFAKSRKSHQENLKMAYLI